MTELQRDPSLVRSGQRINRDPLPWLRVSAGGLASMSRCDQGCRLRSLGAVPRRGAESAHAPHVRQKTSHLQVPCLRSPGTPRGASRCRALGMAPGAMEPYPRGSGMGCGGSAALLPWSRPEGSWTRQWPCPGHIGCLCCFPVVKVNRCMCPKLTLRLGGRAMRASLGSGIFPGPGGSRQSRKNCSCAFPRVRDRRHFGPEAGEWK